MQHVDRYYVSGRFATQLIIQEKQSSWKEEMANQVVRVRKESIAACTTCPLCNKLLRDATTICECLHTFCRKCIYGKIADQGLECCPVCEIDLGCVPLEKLRPDHNLEDVRAKIFPFRRRKIEAPEVSPSVTLPVRRKERSLSSLVVSTPKVLAQTSTTGKRTKPVARKAAALRGPSFSIEKLIKKEEDLATDCPDGSGSPETLKKLNRNSGQNSVLAELSQPPLSDKVGDGADPWDGKSDLWQPLNCLVEVANRTKYFKSNSQQSDAKLHCAHVPDSELQVRKTKLKENKNKLKVEDEKNDPDRGSSDPAQRKKLRRICQKKSASFGGSGVSQAILDAVSGRQERKAGPIWFSLVASENQEGDAPLPQIPVSYMRIKDGSIPVSFIHKYLMKKLHLNSESEVEIRCMEQPVVPTLRLYNLVDLWLQTAPTSERVTATVGSSAKDFVMVLAYARKIPRELEQSLLHILT